MAFADVGCTFVRLGVGSAGFACAGAWAVADSVGFGRGAESEEGFARGAAGGGSFICERSTLAAVCGVAYKLGCHGIAWKRAHLRS